MNKNSRKGFTLAELLIVVAIIAVLVAISIPIFHAQLRKARLAANQANGRAAFSAAEAAYLDYVAGHGSIQPNQTVTVGSQTYDTVTFSYFTEAGKGILKGYFQGGWLVGGGTGDKMCTNTNVSSWTVDTACGDGLKVGDRIAKIWTIHMNADNGSIVGYYCAYPSPSYSGSGKGGWSYYQSVLKAFADGMESQFEQK